VQIYEDFATEQNPNGTIFTSGQALTRRCGVLETSPSFLIHLTWVTRTNITAMSTFLKRSSPLA